MLIPLQFEPPEDYLTRVAEALLDAGTHVYVDTSFAMWLAAIGPASRAAFLDWTTTVVGRLHVPTWTIQEFYRHHRRGTLKSKVEKQCAEVIKAAADFRSAMRLHADGELFPGEPPAA